MLGSLAHLMTLYSPALLLELQPSATDPMRHRIARTTGLRTRVNNFQNRLGNPLTKKLNAISNGFL
jgi:hypothetical protein